MVSMKFKVTWKAIILPVLGLLSFFVYLYLFNVDIPTIIAMVQQIDLTIYFFGIVLIMLEAFFFALSWRLLLDFLSVKLSVVKSFLYVWYGVFMDIIIPAESISGEISRVYLVTREQDGTSGKVIASLVTHRLIGMGTNITTLLIGISALLLRGRVSGDVLNLTLFLAIVTTISLVLLILLCVKEQWTLRIIDAVIRFVEYVSRRRWKLAKIRKNAFEVARIFHDSMNEFVRAPKTLFASIFLHAIAWVFSLGVAYFVFLAMRYPVPWSVIIVTSSIVVAVKAVPLGVPFEIGLPEITMTTLYTLLGVPFDVSATATILTRILTLWLRFFVGFVVQQWLEIQTIRQQQAQKT
ncbi:MAG: flippase-like domain-containing protein [Candidatus Bathyarchaeota archaeon]|nr:flippase-like domain-containing protein [Candidatus Bathyarchaeota archaeon]